MTIGWNFVGPGDECFIVSKDDLNNYAIYGYDYDKGQYYPLTFGDRVRRGHAYWVYKGRAETQTRALHFDLSMIYWDWLELASHIPTLDSLSKHAQRPLPSESLGLLDSWHRIFIKRPMEVLQFSTLWVFKVLHRLALAIGCKAHWKMKIYNLFAGIRLSSRFRKLKIKRK